MEQHCALCGKYIHRTEDPIRGKDGKIYHAHCYSRVKDKLEKEYEKKGLISKIKRSFRQPEAYLSEIKQVYNMLLKEQFGGTCDFNTWAVNTQQFGPNDGKEIREWVAVENEDDLTVYCAYNYGHPGYILFSVDRENNDIPNDIVETCMFEVVDEDWFDRMKLSEDYDEPEDDEDIDEAKKVYSSLLKEDGIAGKATLLQLNIDPKDFGYKSTVSFLLNNWETYGFDFDTERLGVIWPNEVSLEELKANLDKDEIEYEEFEVDLDRYISKNRKEQSENTYAFSQGFKAGKSDAQEGQFNKTKNPYKRDRPTKASEMRILAKKFKEWVEGYESGYRWSEAGPP